MNKKKILAIVYRYQNSNLEFLALRNNPKDSVHGGDFYYVVTGGVYESESLEDAVRREINEETGIDNIVAIKDTGMVYEYKHPGEGDHLCEEKCYLAEVVGEVKHLNEENISYKWLGKEDFIKTVYWYSNRADLERIMAVIFK